MTIVLNPEPLLRALHDVGVRHDDAVAAEAIEGELGGIPLRVCGLDT
jgi:hypothetical protein